MSGTKLVDIATACGSRSLVTVVGIVVDVMPLTRTRGSSSCITFELKDENLDGYAWEDSFKVKYFNDNESHIPDVHENDVVLLRNIPVTIIRGRPTGVAAQAQKVPWAVFRADSDDRSRDPSITTGPAPFQPTSMEKQKAIELLDKVVPSPQLTMARPSRRNAASSTPKSSTVIEASISSSSQKQPYLKLTLIKDIEVDRFCRIVGQVVKDHHYEGDKSTLWITDYTENGDLPNHDKEEEGVGTEGDPYGYLSKRKQWPGPWGRLTMQVTLWDPHATFTRGSINVGDIVLLSYVRPKFSRNSGLEAVIHEDRQFPSKLHIRKVSPDYDQDAQELMKRRKDYWKIHGTKKDEAGPTKKQKKAQEKTQEKAKVQRKEEGQKSLSIPATSSRTKTNANVRPREFGTPVRTVDSILTADTHFITLPGGVSYKLPFQNVCYKLLVRVVDFYPPNLEDFAVEVPSTSVLDEDSEYMTWGWRFCLYVEGVEPLMSKDQQRARLKIFVSGGEAEHLLCLDATNLRQNTHRLAELREKLSILWGDLEEKKSLEPTPAEDQPWAPVKCSNLPFTCCIKEYGVPCLHGMNTKSTMADEKLCVQEDCFGWERRFSLWATTIHDQS